VGIRGLSTVRVPADEEIGLVQLRKLLQDAGLRDLEREATYSIERHRTSVKFENFKKLRWRDRRVFIGRLLQWLDGIFRLVAFDLTTAYGWHPGRALQWMLLVRFMTLLVD
jgi:hypothetical protein